MCTTILPQHLWGYDFQCLRLYCFTLTGTILSSVPSGSYLWALFTQNMTKIRSKSVRCLFCKRSPMDSYEPSCLSSLEILIDVCRILVPNNHIFGSLWPPHWDKIRLKFAFCLFWKMFPLDSYESCLKLTETTLKMYRLWAHKGHILQGLTLSIWFTCPSGLWFWKFTCPAKFFTCPANICTSPVKLMYTAGKISTCPDWKITCPVGHVTTKVYVPWEKIYMPRACRHALMSSPVLCPFLPQIVPILGQNHFFVNFTKGFHWIHMKLVWLAQICLSAG